MRLVGWASKARLVLLGVVLFTSFEIAAKSCDQQLKMVRSIVPSDLKAILKEAKSTCYTRYQCGENVQSAIKLIAEKGAEDHLPELNVLIVYDSALRPFAPQGPLKLPEGATWKYHVVIEYHGQIFDLDRGVLSNDFIDAKEYFAESFEGNDLQVVKIPALEYLFQYDFELAENGELKQFELGVPLMGFVEDMYQKIPEDFIFSEDRMSFGFEKLTPIYFIITQSGREDYPPIDQDKFVEQLAN